MTTGAYISFAFAVLLAITGVVALMKARRSRQLMLAFIPGILAVTECLKGLSWRFSGLNTTPDYASLAGLFLILVVWPWYVPLSLLLPERNAWKRKKIKMLLLVGCCISAYFLRSLLIFDFSVIAKDGHLGYGTDIPGSQLRILVVFYFLPILVPTLVSGLKRIKVFGGVMLVSYLFSQLYFEDSFPQLGSFFAFLTGLSVLQVIWRSNPGTKLVLPEPGPVKN